MFKILIADDEDLIRQGIIAILKKALEPDIAYLEADNGLDAFRLCKEECPQIVISDIRMPFCNGLDFIKKIKDLGISPTFIILSGYTDFEYAKSAITLGVREYVLKPIQKKAFIDTVQSYVEKIRKDQQAVHDEHVDYQTHKRAVDTLRHKLILELLDSDREDRVKSNLKDLEGLGTSLSYGFALCCAVQYKTDEYNRDYIDEAVKNVLCEMISTDGKCHAVVETISCGETAAVFAGSEYEALLGTGKAVMSSAVQALSRVLGAEVFVGIGDPKAGPVRFHESFLHALDAVDYKLYETGSRIQTFSAHAVERYRPIQFHGVIQSIGDADPGEIVQRFNALMEQPPSLQAVSAIKKSYLNLTETLRSLMEKYHYKKIEGLPQPPPFQSYWTFMQLKRGIKAYVGQVKNVSLLNAEAPNKKLIVDVLQYIESNAAGDINLNTVADHFSHTPSYISSLFKKTVGIGFSEYLTKVRMKMAEDMLANTNIPISEISRLCGYFNSKYFASSFKKNFGRSPTAFREKSVEEKR
mgnify:CR=1 FL=1